MVFKLKRMPSEMDYDTVRARQREREKNGSEELADDPTRKPETSEVSDVSEASSSTETTGETVPVTDIDPAGFDHQLPEPEPEPEQQEPASGSSVSTGTDTALHSARGPEEAGEQRRKTSDRSARITKPVGEDQSQRVTIKGYAAQPVSGVSATYDEIAPVYGEQAALSHLIDVALTSFVEALEAGQVDQNQVTPIYSSVAKKRQVHRTIPKASYEIILDKVDPNRILKPGTAGRAIVQGALNYFVIQEKERSKGHR